MVTELWSHDHYEQNQDYKDLNDHACWSLVQKDGTHFLVVANDNDGNRTAVPVTGPVQEAKAKLVAAAADRQSWPSVFLGPSVRDPGLWDELCDTLDLTRVGAPFLDKDEELVAD